MKDEELFSLKLSYIDIEYLNELFNKHAYSYILDNLRNTLSELSATGRSDFRNISFLVKMIDYISKYNPGTERAREILHDILSQEEYSRVLTHEYLFGGINSFTSNSPEFAFNIELLRSKIVNTFNCSDILNRGTQS